MGDTTMAPARLGWGVGESQAGRRAQGDWGGMQPGPQEVCEEQREAEKPPYVWALFSRLPRRSEAKL